MQTGLGTAARLTEALLPSPWQVRLHCRIFRRSWKSGISYGEAPNFLLLPPHPTPHPHGTQQTHLCRIPLRATTRWPLVSACWNETHLSVPRNSVSCKGPDHSSVTRNPTPDATVAFPHLASSSSAPSTRQAQAQRGRETHSAWRSGRGTGEQLREVCWTNRP